MARSCDECVNTLKIRGVSIVLSKVDTNDMRIDSGTLPPAMKVITFDIWLTGTDESNKSHVPVPGAMKKLITYAIKGVTIN